MEAALFTGVIPIKFGESKLNKGASPHILISLLGHGNA